MGRDLIGGMVSIALAIVGIALVAVIVGKNSQTAQILQTGGNAFSTILKAATAPA